MLNKKFIILSTLLLSITLTNNANVVETNTAKSDNTVHFSKELADVYLKSFPKIDSEKQEGKSYRELKQKKKKKFDIKSLAQDQKKLDAYNKRSIVFNKFLKNSERFTLYSEQKQNIFNPYAWEDLKLLYGTTTQPTAHLLSQINKTKTVLGECALTSLITTPISDVEELKKRQRMVRIFLDNSEIMKSIQNEFTLYNLITEANLFSLFTPQDQIYNEAYQEIMAKKFYTKNAKRNKYSEQLNFKKRFLRDFWDIGYSFISPFVTAGIISGSMVLIFPKLTDNEGIKYIFKSFTPYYNIYNTNQTIKEEERSKKKKKDIAEKVGRLSSPIFLSVLYTYNIYKSYKRYQENSRLLSYMAESMANLQFFLKRSEYIMQYIEKNEEIEKLYTPYLKGLKTLLNKNKEKSELGRLIKYLKALPLKNWSYFFSNAGQLLASFKLFEEHQQDFNDAFYDFGVLDAFVSIAQLIQDAKEYDEKNNFQFVTYLEKQENTKPSVKITEMWNPFIDAKKVVPNSVEIGSEKDKIQTIILTGPNAAGKSTFLTGVTQSILLAQVFGIAPAKEMTLTPFDKINTYINKGDDIASGKSLFQVEAEHAAEHLKMLENLKPTEFSFSIMDELFSGTNPKEGEAAAYSIMEYIQQYQNGLNIIATHFPRVMLLEKNAPRFANYKVFIKKGDETNPKKIIYTYKIIPGKSTQAIAIDILEAEGYDTKLLARARDIVEHPEKYQANF